MDACVKHSMPCAMTRKDFDAIASNLVGAVLPICLSPDSPFDDETAADLAAQNARIVAHASGHIISTPIQKGQRS